MGEHIRLLISSLGPLRDTEAAFADITLVVDDYGVGGYLLRALYGALALGDPLGLAGCIGSGGPGIENLIRLERWSGGARVCLDPAGLAEAVKESIRGCLEGLLPPHRVEVLRGPRWGLRRACAREAMAAAEALSRIYGGRVAEHGGGFCVEAPGPSWPGTASAQPDVMLNFSTVAPVAGLLERCLSGLGVLRVVYAPPGRALVAQALLRAASPRGKPLQRIVAEELLAAAGPQFLGFYAAAARGLGELLRGAPAAVRAVEAFRPLLGGGLRVVNGEPVYEPRGGWGAAMPLALAPSHVAEAAALALAVAGLVSQGGGERWLLIEEPESHLSPALQAVAAAILLWLASEEAVRIAVATRSRALARSLLRLLAAARAGRLAEALAETRGSIGVDLPAFNEDRLRALDSTILFAEEGGGEGYYRLREAGLEEALATLSGPTSLH